MFMQTSYNLDIQIRYLDILRSFLDSEHAALRHGELYTVYQLETSIREILEIIREKRQELKNDLDGVSVRDYASELPEKVAKVFRKKLDFLTKIEEECLLKASRNAGLSQALAAGADESGYWNSVSGANAEGRVQ